MKKVNFKIINLVLIFSLFGNLTISNFAYAEGENPEEVPLILESTETKDEIIVENAILSTDNNLVASTEEPTPEEIPNNDIVIEPLPTTTIHLQIQTYDQELYSNDFIVTACPNTENGTENTLNAWCAIQQLSKEKDWAILGNWYSDQVFLNKINNYDGSDFNYWLWYNNYYVPGTKGLNQEILEEQENIYLFYGLSQLKIETSTTTPFVNSTTTLNIKESSGYDENWNEILSNSASSTLFLNGEEIFDEDGIYELFITTTTPYTIYAKKNGFITSEIMTINPVENSNNTEEENDITTNTPSESNGSSSSNTTNNFIDNAFVYLNSKIENGNFFDSTLYTDWAAIAYGSYSNNSQQKESIANYLINNPLSDNSEITDYERRAMALMSLDKNPYNSSSINYIQKIIESFDGKQIGENTLYNDDIFGIITLVNAGYNYEDEIIKISTDFLLSKQNTKIGNFGDIDMTAAAIQALKSLNTTNENVILAIESAKNYLKSKQDNNSSFNSNLFSTTWALQAIDALDENENDWNKNGTTPSDYLKSAQQSDGGISSKEENTEQTRVWITSYAIPAYLNKNWNEILKDFSKTNISNENISNSNTATTTLQIPTTTIEIVLEEEMPTSTEEIVEVAENEQDMEILPVLYTIEENILDIAKTNSKPKNNSNNNPKIEETRGEKIVEEQDSVEETEDEEIFEDVDNSSENISETTEQEKLPANKKIAISLGLGALLYGLFLVFKLFV
ncbi:MAG: prenyltransferase/squalene oxidase repeat-containing protein [Candidatus Magasanikbacteria bacterium]